MDGHELITGDTYPVREALRLLGGHWDETRGGWWVPTAAAPRARLLARPRSAPPRRGSLRPHGPHGICTACGDDCGGTAWRCGYA